MDGFAFALGQDGRFLYISETVSIYLGLSQVEMTGSSIFDYTHQQDHTELAEQLGEFYFLEIFDFQLILLLFIALRSESCCTKFCQ